MDNNNNIVNKQPFNYNILSLTNEFKNRNLINETDIQQYDETSFIGEGVLERINQVLLWMTKVTNVQIEEFIKKVDFVCGFNGEISFEFEYEDLYFNLLFVCKKDKLIVVKDIMEQLIFEDYYILKSDKFL